MGSRAVEKFQEYLRIKSVHPNPDYDGIVKFLDEYADELKIAIRKVEVAEDRVVVVMTVPGKQPQLKTILLNSHTDVVPVYEDQWKCDAFAAIKEVNGDIYGRGTQDMKSVGIQYLEAIRKLNDQGVKMERTIHLCFVPDEEIGAAKGMQAFIKTPLFKELNIGFVLDEGLANPDNKYSVYNAERSPWWIKVNCTGNPGHGSRFIENTAAEKLRKLLNVVLEYREQERLKLEESKSCLVLGDVTTVNLTELAGGLAHNIVPAELTATFDIRITPSVDFKKFEEKLQGWCALAGEGVTYSFIQKNDNDQKTSTEKSDPWWNAFSSACKDLEVELSLEIFSGATDSRFLRRLGLPAIGFSPIKNTPILLHDHNEFLNENVFLEGIEAYCRIIPALANVAEF